MEVYRFLQHKKGILASIYGKKVLEYIRKESGIKVVDEEELILGPEADVLATGLLLRAGFQPVMWYYYIYRS